MQALTLMIVYVLTTFAVQFIGFLLSRLVDYEWPTLGLMTFLILFMGAFGIAWPIAVRLAEWLIRARGYVVETEQSGGDARMDVARPKLKAASSRRGSLPGSCERGSTDQQRGTAGAAASERPRTCAIAAAKSDASMVGA
jgi:hypothetical protein